MFSGTINHSLLTYFLFFSSVSEQVIVNPEFSLNFSKVFMVQNEILTLNVSFVKFLHLIDTINCYCLLSPSLKLVEITKINIYWGLTLLILYKTRWQFCFADFTNIQINNHCWCVTCTSIKYVIWQRSVCITNYTIFMYCTFGSIIVQL